MAPSVPIRGHPPPLPEGSALQLSDARIGNHPHIVGTGLLLGAYAISALQFCN
jgi:hypothetical protein